MMKRRTTHDCPPGHHDHDGPNGVVIPTPSDGRKYHCGLSRLGEQLRAFEAAPSAEYVRSGKWDLRDWRFGSESDAIAQKVPRCELCFGPRR
jgi:hypothetical protein